MTDPNLRRPDRQRRPPLDRFGLPTAAQASSESELPCFRQRAEGGENKNADRNHCDHAGACGRGSGRDAQNHNAPEVTGRAGDASRDITADGSRSEAESQDKAEEEEPQHEVVDDALWRIRHTEIVYLGRLNNKHTGSSLRSLASPNSMTRSVRTRVC